MQIDADTKEMLIKVLDAQITPEEAAERLKISLMELWNLMDNIEYRITFSDDEWKRVQKIEKDNFDYIIKKIFIEEKPPRIHVNKVQFHNIKGNNIDYSLSAVRNNKDKKIQYKSTA